MPAEEVIYFDLRMDLIIRINRILVEKKMTKKELADLLGKKPSEISKWLNKDHNFSLKTIAKLSAVLNEPLIMVEHK